MAYLDKDGVRKLWAKVKALFNKGVTDISINGKTVTITKGDGSTSAQTTQDTEYSVFRGATNSADGSNGLVPAPKSGKQDSFLKGDGTWGTPENTKYNVVSKTAAGLAPQLPNETSTTKYLRQDGTWAVPPNQTYNKATHSSDGLMAKEDKTKLDGLPTGTELENTYADKSSYLKKTDAVLTYVSKTGLSTELAHYAKKSDITNMYVYKGSVADASKLPTTGQQVGWTYNIETASQYGGAGMNVAWDGTKWDPLGEIFTITAITDAELDEICV
jgi:hypothetical protein